MQFIENKTFDDIKVGDSASLTRTLHSDDITLFAILSGDINPAHVDADYAKTDLFHHIVAHGMWGGTLISAVLGTELPGPGTIYLSQSLEFRHPVGLDDRITATVTVREKDNAKHRLILDCICRNQSDQIVIEGSAEVIAPTEKVKRPRALLPELHMHVRGERHRHMVEAAAAFPPMRMAIVHPCDALALNGALDAADAKLIVPVLVGPIAKIRKAAVAAGRSIENIEMVDAPHSHAAAEIAVELARAGKVEALMKGALHTDEVMGAVVAHDGGLRTERRMSHVFVLDVPTYPKPLFVTDAAINIAPTLEDKRDIILNVIDLCHALGIAGPKIALLSAVETVESKIGSTLEAAALCKMAERGQIEGGLLDGPLAFDNAISKRAAAEKHIVSAVAGDADVLLAPDLEAGNILAKQLIYLAEADAAGIVLGARVPIVLTSRADNAAARVASCALARLLVEHMLKSPMRGPAT
ncbi:bifunctional enoyl-CoA hydratase/phosphate acetyltransferase [Methylovirgula sp. HY1]|uniref:bifunctional enoyl-CoA hydratase/phosphate acetyltransferase n=1 Tax=Methylovirgula sp. HY1 TaxID=2822761 RepID=UPI001C5BA0E9|nr:bifunctional enoyl-CoA hydratase/phosphate acetyltransferase [Methylovirgula sp. HY1]QXX73322.1 Phosphate acetyltransferase [Methylovirgula sp. HY1]